jgi:diguanylate cyclase (GGDEF)-like protein/PAS domain S-box-containing protein
LSLLSERLLDLARMALLALLYFLLGLIALSFVAVGNAAMLWPSVGLALAALLTYGSTLWPGVFLGAFAVGIMVGDPLWLSALIAAGNTLEPLAAVALLSRFGFDRKFATLKDYYRLVCLAVLGCSAISGVVGPSALMLAERITPNDWSAVMFRWWMGDMMGALLAVPLLIWWQAPCAWAGNHRAIEALVLFGLTFLVGGVVFCGWETEVFAFRAKGFLVFPMLIWAALRFGRHGASLVVLLVLVQSLWGVVHGVGYFGQDQQETGLVTFWLFQVTLNAAGMTLAIALRERRDLTQKLDQERALFREHLDFSPFAFAAADIQTGRIAFLNRRFVELFGYPLAEVPTLDAWYQRAYPDPSYRRRVIEEWTELVENSQRSGVPVLSYEAQVTAKDGRVRNVEFSCTGPREHLLVSINDVTRRKRTEERERARSLVLEKLATGAPLNEVLETIVRCVETDNPSMRCSILLLDDEEKHLVVGASPSLPDFYNAVVDGMEVGPGRGSCGNSAFTGERTVVENVQTHPFWTDFRQIASQAAIASCWSEPIRSTQGKILGTFAVHQSAPQSPTQTDLALIEYAAHLARIAIERKRAEEQQQLAASVYQAASEAIFVTDGRNRIIAVNPSFTRLTGYTAAEVIGRHPSILDTDSSPESFYRVVAATLEKTDHWQGEASIRRKNGETFIAGLTINSLRNEQGQVYRHIALFNDITEKKQAEELVWLQANYDPLTNLPNRRLFRDRLLHEMKLSHRAGHELALLLIDLDRFKEVNDLLGHDIGDLLLVEAARRIAACVRETDTVARLGGDEFAAVLPNLVDGARVEQVAQAIIHTLSEPFHLNQELVHVSASVGVAFYPNDAADLEDLLKSADQAMFEVKNQGRNGVSYFTRALHEMAQERQNIIRDLRKALAAGQFEVHFQPIADLSSGRIVKAEALLRWRHPTRGMVDPGEFIAVAEDIGLIREIGDWVFKQAVNQAKRYFARGADLIPISINKSPRQFYTGESHENWLDYLKDNGLPPEYIVVEITESLLLDGRSEVKDKLRQFHEAGIGVSIDDFGTGFSSLPYLKQFHIDCLKIDRTLVRDLTTDPDHRALAEAIIALAHKLGLKVVAEGVETEAQRDLLAAAGCDYAQGYLYARPLPPDEFDALLAATS